MFKVSPASLQSFINWPNCVLEYRQAQGDTRLTLAPSVIPNSIYVVMVIETVQNICVFCTVIIRCTEIFLINLYLADVNRTFHYEATRINKIYMTIIRLPWRSR
jgi:hypothetical protein